MVLCLAKHCPNGQTALLLHKEQNKRETLFPNRSMETGQQNGTYESLEVG